LLASDEPARNYNVHGRESVPARLWVRGDRVEAAGWTLPVAPLARLTQCEELGTILPLGRCALHAAEECDRRLQMGSEFACPSCDSPSVAYPDEDGEDRVICAGCGAFLATRGQFRRLIVRREKLSEIRTSGC
jgi:hypothetical protein